MHNAAPFRFFRTPRHLVREGHVDARVGPPVLGRMAIVAAGGDGEEATGAVTCRCSPIFCGTHPPHQGFLWRRRPMRFAFSCAVLLVWASNVRGETNLYRLRGLGGM